LKINFLLEAIAMEGHSLALGKALRDFESEKASLQASLDMEAQKAVLGSEKAIKQRLDDVKVAIHDGDMERVNSLFRRLFHKVIVNVQDRSLSVEWIGQ
jgi:hypothetical protein